MERIILARNSGFCYGVKRAVDRTEELIEENRCGKSCSASEQNKTTNERTESTRNIFTYGSLIHNEIVVNRLREAGVVSCEDIDSIPRGSILVIRSHGVPEAVYKEAEAAGIIIEDVTCPFVARIHDIVRQESEAGKQIIIVGDETHPEVKGIIGWCRGDYICAKNAEELKTKLLLQKNPSRDHSKNKSNTCVEGEAEGLSENLPKLFPRNEAGAAERKAGTAENSGQKPLSTTIENTSTSWEISPIAIVAQTTIKTEDFLEAVDYMKRINPQVSDFNTICSATRERQKGCEETSVESDLMLVIGSRNSSNTMKLLDIAKKNCKKSYLIEILQDLPLKEIEKCGTIGVAAGASAPECIIKEVISTMSELITENIQENMGMAEYMDAIEKSLRLPGRGEIVTGTIFSVNDRQIVVDLGHKKDGIVPKDEVSLEPGQSLKDAFNVGDEIEAKVLKTKDDDGNILLSLKKLEVNAQWKEVNDALEDKTLVTVKVTNKVKGGVIAAYKEVSGFIPLSQLSDKFTEDVDAFIGQEIPVRVIQTNPKRNRAVFSHRVVILEEKAKKTEAFWNSIEIGDIVDGTVKRFTDYGAFVDIGGVDGLLHISEISWGKIRKPQDVLELEQPIKVKILSMNKEKGKISLGLKQTIPEPWANIDSKYQVGDIIVGKVVQLKEYGAFIEIEPGLDGLVHISEIAYKRVASPADELEIGQNVNAKILDIDADKKRISLSIKETIEKPLVSEDEAEEAPAEEAQAEAPAEE